MRHSPKDPWDFPSTVPPVVADAGLDPAIIGTPTLMSSAMALPFDRNANEVSTAAIDIAIANREPELVFHSTIRR